MNRVAVTVLLGISVFLASAVLMAGATSGWIISLAGFFFVVGGSLLTAIFSESFERIEAVLKRMPEVFKPWSLKPGDDETLFLQAAEYYRRGSVRRAELFIKGIDDGLLRQGSQLIMDGCSLEELNRTLQWRLAHAKEHEKQHLRIMHAMAGFAPAFGMLGTLLGLVHMLFHLGEEGLGVVGASMGFAMITTVYGLVAANLIIKPIAIKMEARSRERLAWEHVKYELLLMLFQKDHPTLMRESLEAFFANHTQPSGLPSTRRTAKPGLARAS